VYFINVKVCHEMLFVRFLFVFFCQWTIAHFIYMITLHPSAALDNIKTLQML